MGPDIPFFWQAGHADGWRCSSNSNKRVCICDICYKQIHVRKISIMCNRIEHWVQLRSSGIRQAQHTDTRTCHLHRESRLTTHTDIPPPHPSKPWSKQWVDNINNKKFSSYEKYMPLPGRLLLRRGCWSLLKCPCWTWLLNLAFRAMWCGINRLQEYCGCSRHDRFLVDMVNDGFEYNIWRGFKYTCEEDSNTTCDEYSNTTCNEEGGERHTGNKLWRFS